MDKLGYIPGDLVYIHGNLRIINNCDGYYATYYDEDETLQETNVNVIEGIPLTKEILEKNGWSREGGVFGVSPDFKKIIDDPARKKGYITCLSVYPFFDKDGFSFFYNNQKLAIIHYIHELQHILYGLKINSEMEV